MPDQDQIVDRTCVGDNNLPPSESETLEIMHIAAHILNGHPGPDLMSLQRVVEFATCFKAEKTAAFAAQFQVPVAKDGEATLAYRVRVKY